MNSKMIAAKTDLDWEEIKRDLITAPNSCDNCVCDACLGKFALDDSNDINFSEEENDIINRAEFLRFLINQMKVNTEAIEWVDIRQKLFKIKDVYHLEDLWRERNPKREKPLTTNGLLFRRNLTQKIRDGRIIRHSMNDYYKFNL